MKKFLLNGLLASILIFGALLQAEEDLADILQKQSEEGVPDRLQVRLGGFLIANQGTNVTLTKDGIGAGIELDTLFNIEANSNVFRLDGYYRFTPRHSLEYSWYSINNSGKTGADVDFQFGDLNITAEDALSTYFNADVYKVNYLYSFYHTEKVELGLAVGVHITSMDIGFSGDYTSNRTDKSGDESVSFTAPLPVIGARVSYNFSPKWRLKYSIDHFIIGFDGAKGSLTDAMLTVDYRIWSHFGMGIGYNAINLDLDVTTDEDVELKLYHNIGGGLIYGAMYF